MQVSIGCIGVRDGNPRIERFDQRAGRVMLAASAHRPPSPLPFGGHSAAEQRRRSVVGTLYAQGVMSSSNQKGAARIAGSLVARGRDVALLIVGALIDLCAVINVPGAAFLPAASDGEVSTTGLGVALVMIALAAWVSVIWRERHPLVVLFSGGVLALIGSSYLLLLVGTVSTARRYPTRLRLLGTVVCSIVALFVLREAVTPWGGALAWFFSQDTDDGPTWIVVSCVVAVTALAVTCAIVFASRSRDRAAQSHVRAQYEQRRADELDEQMVRQAERERIARDMHDALAHRLSVVSLHAGALEGAADGAAGEIARTVREQTHAALQDMRGLIGDLRSGPGETVPSTMRAIGGMLSELRAGGVVIVAYVVLEAPERASAQLDSAVHRIVQEALTNAIKHATAESIDVFVQVGPQGGARIRVENRVRETSEPIAPGGRHGVLGIRERARALGGTAWIGAHEGAFIVDVTLPWQERGAPSLSSTGEHR